MRTPLVTAAAAMALFVVAIDQTETKAQTGGPETHPWCALSGAGPTVCYYDSREQCKIAAEGTCFENQGYVGASNAHSEVTHARAPTHPEGYARTSNRHFPLRHANAPTHPEGYVRGSNGHSQIRHASASTHSEVH
jgi:Protein of unknown function (DUF3551)